MDRTFLSTEKSNLINDSFWKQHIGQNYPMNKIKAGFLSASCLANYPLIKKDQPC